MKDLTARHVQETDSIRRGIRDGWYAISPAGAICSGLFLTEAACEAHSEQERADINAYHQGATNQHLTRVGTSEAEQSRIDRADLSPQGRPDWLELQLSGMRQFATSCNSSDTIGRNQRSDTPYT